MPSGAEQGRFSTPVSSKHRANNNEADLAKEIDVDPDGPSPPPLPAPLSDDTLDASSAEKEASNNYQQHRSGRSDLGDSPFAATPSPIGNRTLSNSEYIGQDDTINGTFDTDISRTLHISEIDESESVSLFLSNKSHNNGEAPDSSRRNSTSNDNTTATTALKSILELSEIDTTFDGAALNRTIGATDASTSASSRFLKFPPRDLSEIDITMDRTARDTSSSSTGNANSIEESNLQAELALDSSERMQRMLEEATSGGSSTGGGTCTDAAGDGEDEHSTLAGQAFVGGGASGASVMTSGSMASYSIGGNTTATAGTDIADFLRKQNEAMQRALAGAGAGAGADVGGSTKKGGEVEAIISPTKTRAVDAAVENARIMAEATARLTPTGNTGNGGNDSSSPEVQRNSSMEFGSQSHLNVGATGKFTTDDPTGAVSVTVQSVKTTVSSDNAEARKSISKSVRAKSVSAKTAVSSSSSTYQSQYALSPSQRAKESMTVAEKIRQAEAEAMARDGGPRFEKMSAVSETDDDYVPIADFTIASAKKSEKIVGSFEYNDYSPDIMMASPEGSAVQRYRIMMRRKKRRRQRRMIRAGLVALVVAAIFFWWYRVGSGEESANGEDDVNSLEEDVARSLVEEVDAVESSIHLIDEAVEDAEQPSTDIDEGEEMEEVIEADVVDAPSIDGTSPAEDVLNGDEKDEEDSFSLASAFAREKIQLVNTNQAPIVKLFKAAKAGISSVEPRAVPFSYFWNKEVWDTAKSKPVLSGIDELLDSMLQ